MGDCPSTDKGWLPGYAPDQCGAPSLEENNVKDGIQDALSKSWQIRREKLQLRVLYCWTRYMAKMLEK